MNRLLEEERLIISMLRRYECLRVVQIKALIHYKTPEMADSIISGLERRQMIFNRGDGNLRIHPKARADNKMITAFWVFLQFLNDESKTSNFKADHPSRIFFLKDNTPYEVVVIEPGESNLIKMLKINSRSYAKDENDQPKYIIAVSDHETLSEVALHADGLDSIFAVVPFVTGSAIPEIEFLAN